MSELYIITKVEFKYDDQVYHSEMDAGTPIKAFRSLEKAKRFMREEELNFWFGGNNAPSEYGYETEQVYAEGWASKVFPKKEIDCWKVIEEIDPEKIEAKFASDEMWTHEFSETTKNWPESVKLKFIEHAILVKVFTINKVEVDETTA